MPTAAEPRPLPTGMLTIRCATRWSARSARMGDRLPCQSDTNGDTALDQTETIATAANGTVVDTVVNLNPDGSQKNKTITATSADGLTTTAQMDLNGDGTVRPDPHRGDRAQCRRRHDDDPDRQQRQRLAARPHHHDHERERPFDHGAGRHHRRRGCRRDDDRRHGPQCRRQPRRDRHRSQHQRVVAGSIGDDDERGPQDDHRQP